MAERFSRRDFLDLALVATGSLIYSSCVPKEEPTPFPTSEPTERPVSTREPTPDPTPTLEPIRPAEPLGPPEIIDIDIPGMKVTQYSTDIRDVTRSLPEDYKKVTEGVLQPFYPIYGTELSPSYLKEINTGGYGGLYFNRLDEKYFAFNSELIHPNTLSDEDKILLGWEKGNLTLLEVSDDGKAMYEATTLSITLDGDHNKFRKLLLIDIEGKTKTTIEDTDGIVDIGSNDTIQFNPQVDLSRDGSHLLLSYYEHMDVRERDRSTYIVDLYDWSVVALDLDNWLGRDPWYGLTERTYGPNKDLIVSNDGRTVYSPYYGAKIDTQTGVKEAIIPIRLGFADSSDIAIASGDLQFIAQSGYRSLSPRMFVHTPNGLFGFTSTRGITPRGIEDDGTIYTGGHPSFDIFQFKDGGYIRTTESRAEIEIVNIEEY